MQDGISGHGASTGEGTRDEVATGETAELIASDKVEGTSVYNRDGEHLGSIRTLMIDKRTGQVRYAVMSFGGILGIGERYHPLPWGALTYEPRQGGYVVELQRDRLEGAPSYGRDEAPWGDPLFGNAISAYYGVPFPRV